MLVMVWTLSDANMLSGESEVMFRSESGLGQGKMAGTRDISARLLQDDKRHSL